MKVSPIGMGPGEQALTAKFSTLPLGTIDTTFPSSDRKLQL